jgi:hypothetical protein
MEPVLRNSSGVSMHSNILRACITPESGGMSQFINLPEIFRMSNRAGLELYLIRQSLTHRRGCLTNFVNKFLRIYHYCGHESSCDDDVLILNGMVPFGEIATPLPRCPISGTHGCTHARDVWTGIRN